MAASAPLHTTSVNDGRHLVTILNKLDAYGKGTTILQAATTLANLIVRMQASTVTAASLGMHESEFNYWRHAIRQLQHTSSDNLTDTEVAAATTWAGLADQMSEESSEIPARLDKGDQA